MEKNISIKGKVALVSGANRGMGKEITIQLLENGIQKVYAGARNLDSLNDLKEKYGDKIIPIELDVTDDKSIENISKIAKDTNILINNAGILIPDGFTKDNLLENMKKHYEVNVFGLSKLTYALVNIIKENGDGAIVSLSSAAAFANMKTIMSYSSSKAAVHSLVQGLRSELKDTNILISGVYPGPVDTDMTKGFDIKNMGNPKYVAKEIVDGIENGLEYIFPDNMSKHFGDMYLNSPKAVENEFSKF